MLDVISQNEGSPLPEPAEMETNGRRVVMRRAGFGIAGIAAAGLLASRPANASAATDEAIFNFALNFEYLGAEYYLRAVTGKGLSSFSAVTGVGGSPGTVTGGSPVPFQTEALAYYAQQLANDELAHVLFVRQALGDLAIAEPTIDLVNSWQTLAVAAGLSTADSSTPFNPYANEVNFLLGAYILEDVCVTALAGAAALLTVPDNISYAASLLGAEGYQAGAIRGYLADIGGGDATNAISALRATLGGTFDNGTNADGNPWNFTNVDYNGQVARRTTSQVLSIAYGTNAVGTNKGLFFPNGVNGSITTV